MSLDPVLLARIQFALTIGFHFIFPPISIGLAWVLVVIEGLGWKRNDESYKQAGKFFSKLLAINFAIGVATGIVMEFEFGTNWAEYSKIVGDIFGAPLAAEGVFAFFLESAFLGLYLFGREKVSRGVHWFSILMVAVGSTISAFWIIVANSWQQTPAGFIFQNGRAELTSFFDAVFNPSTLIRFFHTVDAAIITGSFVVVGVSAYLLLKGKGAEVVKKSLRVSLIIAFIASIMAVFPTGHEHARQVAHTQPEKFAAIEGLYTSQSNAPLVMFGLVETEPEKQLAAEIKIPGLLSWMAFGDIDAHVQGLSDFPEDEIPPLWLSFVSFHNMVILGMFFVFSTLLGVIFLARKKLFETKWLLKLFVFSIPLPVLACELGWTTAEVGRQPWVVYKLLKTADAISLTVTSGEILFSIILFSLIYIVLGGFYFFLMVKEVKHGPEAVNVKEVTA